MGDLAFARPANPAAISDIGRARREITSRAANAQPQAAARKPCSWANDGFARWLRYILRRKEIFAMVRRHTPNYDFNDML